MKLKRVKLHKKGITYEGFVLPQSDEKTIVLKLESGYNVGLSRQGTKIEELGEIEVLPPTREAPQERGEIAIISMGGTICSRVEYKTGAVFPSTTPGELMHTLPELEKICSFHTKSLFAMLSEDMSPKHWSIAAEAVKEEIENGVEGVVVLHGTDTMHYSSAALSYMLRDTPVPVVFVGAQRSPDRPSTDARLNILNAAYAAKGPIAHVGICMHADTNDDYACFHLGTRVRKMHTSSRDAFQSIGAKPLAKVDFRKGLFEPKCSYRDRGGKLRFDSGVSENVALVYAYPGMSPKVLDSLADYDGVVIAGTGLGHVATDPFKAKHVKSVLPEIEALCASGIPVVMASQCIYGRVNLNVYTAGRMLQEAGVIGTGADWTPEAAYAKLCWVLGHERDPKKVAEEMMAPVAGEIAPRSVD
jgi:glutamyl-tRNA(Gln) amidotransferase subunit D